MYPVPQHRQHAVQDSDRRSRAATGAFEAKCFTVIEDGVDSSVGGDLAAVRRDMRWKRSACHGRGSSNYRQAFLLAGQFCANLQNHLEKERIFSYNSCNRRPFDGIQVVFSVGSTIPFPPNLPRVQRIPSIAMEAANIRLYSTAQTPTIPTCSNAAAAYTDLLF